MEQNVKTHVSADASVTRKSFTKHDIELENYWSFECWRLGEDGQRYLAWTERTVPNLVTTEGKNDILNKYFAGSSYTAAWYVGLVADGASAYAVGDTLASHANWTEATSYNGARKALAFVGAGASSGTFSTSTAAVFSITGNISARGAFICTTSTGTSGILYGVVDLTGGTRTLINTDILNVSVTTSAS